MNEFNRFGIIVSELQKEVELYEDLFGGSESVSILNEISIAVFSIIQRAMFFEIVTRLAALFDPAKTGKDANLSINHLIGRVEEDLEPETKELISKTKKLYESTGIKKYRSKALAHLDLKQHMGTRVLAPNITYESVSGILVNLEKLVQRMPVEAGILAPGNEIYRSSRLPVKSGGQALLVKLKAMLNKA